MANSQRSKDIVLREFAAVGKYHIRLLRNPRGPDAEPILDVREYLISPQFEGFTRRGIKLTSRAEVDLLRDVLTEVLERGV